MRCPSCKHDFEATNQHSECPHCKERIGTLGDREDLDTLTESIQDFESWEDATQDARKESERDQDYYDGLQWSEEEIAELNKRNQPVVVKNRIFKKINFLLGQEVRNRADPKALPRTPQHDTDANAITDALRYVCDDQDFDFVSSQVWHDVAVKGYGGAVIEHEVVGESIEVRIRAVPWDRLWYDIHSRKPDFSDARSLGVSVWYDLDDAVAFYSDRNDTADDFEAVLEQAIANCGNSPYDSTHDDKPSGVWADNRGHRKRVRISERYYRKGGEWYVCHYTDGGFVVPPKKTGYVDEKGANVCPLQLTSAFVTREGYRYGLVRHMIGPQDEINKRSSKALHWLSVDRVIAEDGAVIDPDGAQTERSKPDGWITVQPGALTGGKIQFEKGMDMAQGQVQLLQEAKGEIDSIGPEMPQIGASPAGMSGRAIQMRQQIGSLELAPIEDNHKRWKRSVYRHIWYRIRQFWPEEKWLRVTDEAERTGFRFVGLNRRVSRAERFQELTQAQVPVQGALESTVGAVAAQFLMQQVTQQHQMMAQQDPAMQQMQPEQQQAHMMQMVAQHPAMQQMLIANDVASLDVDIVLDESPDVAVLQQEEYEKLAELIPAFLQAQIPPQTLLEMMLEASQLRAKRKLLEMLRKPPDENATKIQQAMQQLQQAQAQANVQKTQTEASLNQAKTQRETVEAQVKGSEAQLAGPKAEAEIMSKQAKAMNDAANAGAQAGGGQRF